MAASKIQHESGNVKQFSEAQIQEMAERVKNEQSSKVFDSDCEFAISDAQELAAFLHDVSFGMGTVLDSDFNASTIDTSKSWRGFAQVHAMLIKQLDIISKAYYSE